MLLHIVLGCPDTHPPLVFGWQNTWCTYRGKLIARYKPAWSIINSAYSKFGSSAALSISRAEWYSLFEANACVPSGGLS